MRLLGADDPAGAALRSPWANGPAVDNSKNDKTNADTVDNDN